MAFRGYRLLLSGVAQRLSDVYGDGLGVVNAANDLPYRQILLQGDPAGSNDIYVGHSAAVSATTAGLHLTHTTVPLPVSLGPFETGPIKLSDLWVLGTLNEHLHISGIPF